MILKPFKLVRMLKWEFGAFVIFTLILGQVAILLPLLFSTLNGTEISKSISHLLETGTFYNTIIPILASSIYIVANDTMIQQSKNFRGYKFFIFSLALLLLIINTFLYSDIISFPNIQKKIIQSVFYFLSIYFVLILFLSQHLYLDMKSFQQADDRNVGLLKKIAKNKHNDERGIII